MKKQKTEAKVFFDPMDYDVFHDLYTPVVRLGEHFDPPDWYAWVYGGEKSPCVTGEKPSRRSSRKAQKSVG